MKGSEADLDFNFQISYNKYDPSKVLVTGPDTYKYYSIEPIEDKKLEFQA